MSTARQQRDAARAKLEARMAEKAARARRNRRIQITLSSALAVVLVAGLGVFFYDVIADAAKNAEDTDSGEDSADEEMVPAGDGSPVEDVKIETLTMTAAADPADGSAKCEYVATPEEQLAQNPNVEDVGTPDKGEQPNTGTQQMDIETNHGPIVADIDTAEAPCAAASFTYLAGEKFFDDSTCHRLTTENLFVLQCGDPTGSGSGGPTYGYETENTPKDTAEGLSEEEMAAGEMEPNYKAGTIAIANSGQPNSNGSQFFLVYEDTYLPPDYTVLGELSEGLDVVRKIAEAGAEIPASQQQQQMPVG